MPDFENPDRAGAPSRSGILNGEVIRPTRVIASSVVGLSNNNSLSCSGSLIAANMVLTAAHCIHGSMRGTSIFFGTDFSGRGIELPVVDAVKHPKYGGGGGGGGDDDDYGRGRARDEGDAGDIAMVKFQGQMPRNYFPLPVLPPTMMKQWLRPGLSVAAAGYGSTAGGGGVGDGTLRMVIKKINRWLGPGEIAIDERHHSGGTCYGDSGGPLMIKIFNRTYVWGVVSRGLLPIQDCSKNFGVYTVAPAYWDFIQRTARRFLGRGYMSPLQRPTFSGMNSLFSDESVWPDASQPPKTRF